MAGLKALSTEAQQEAVTAKLPKRHEDDDDLTEARNKPMSLEEMIKNAERSFKEMMAGVHG